MSRPRSEDSDQTAANEASESPPLPRGAVPQPRLRQNAIRASWLERVRAALSIYCLVGLTLVALAVGYGSMRWRMQQERAAAEVRAECQLQAGMLRNEFARLAEDILVLANDPVVQRARPADRASHGPVAERFLVEVSTRPTIRQLRWIGPNGFELVRVNRNGKQIQLVDEASLQDKSNRYYFRDAMKTPLGEVYHSYLDLNIEKGAVQVPWEPNLRVATPLGKASEHFGIVVLNIDVAPLLAVFGEDPEHGTQQVLLNDRGYALAGEDVSKVFGFMFGREDSWTVRFPDLWEKIRAAEEGVFEQNDNYYAFQTIRFGSEGVAQDPPAARFAETESWKVLAVRRIAVASSRWRQERWEVLGLALLVGAGFSWGWGISLADRKAVRCAAAQAQSELVRSEKMAALGSLVAGVAHELGTPIGNAVMIASTIVQKVHAFDELRQKGELRRAALDEFCEDLREGSEIMTRGLTRASELLAKFKLVSVDQSSELRRRFELDSYICEALETIGPAMRKSHVQVELELQSSASLDSYPGPLTQVLLNLVNNAILHAFSPESGGTVKIATRMLDAQRVEVSVADDGMGIAADVLPRVFEPFFTTKFGRGGSGLGLSISQRIVEDRLGGEIQVESVLGQFTKFTMILPVLAPAPRSAIGSEVAA